MQYAADIHNHAANKRIGYKVPLDIATGNTVDISHILKFVWFQPIYYHDLSSSYPESTEKPGYFVGFVNSSDDALTFKILTADRHSILTRSVVRPATDPEKRNRKVKFDAETERELFIGDNILSNQQIHGGNMKKETILKDTEVDGIFSRTRSKNDDSQEPGVHSRTRSKNSRDSTVHYLNIDMGEDMPDFDEDNHEETDSNTSGEIELNYTLQDTDIHTSGGIESNHTLQDTDCICDSINDNLINTSKTLVFKALKTVILGLDYMSKIIKNITDIMEFQNHFNEQGEERLKNILYLTELDKITESQRDPWDKFDKPNTDLWNVKQIITDKRQGRQILLKCEMKNPNEANLWVDSYALAMQDPKCLITYAKGKHIINEQPFYNLAQWCAGDMESDYCRALRAKSGTPGPKFHFGVRVPFGIKQAIQFDKENKNNLWLEATKKELESMNKYKVFRFLRKGQKPPE